VIGYVPVGAIVVGSDRGGTFVGRDDDEVDDFAG
jgi:hypothetical protein